MNREADPYVRLLQKAQQMEQKVFDKKRKARKGGRSGLEALVRKNDLEMKIYADEQNKRKKLEEERAEALHTALTKQQKGQEELDKFLKEVDEKKKARAKELREKAKARNKLIMEI
jgi:hypothetical protein